MLTTYVKAKVFPDGGIKIFVKDSQKHTPESIENSVIIKKANKIEKAERNKKIIEKINRLTFLEEDKPKREKLEKELNKIDLINCKRSARRARQELYEICKCNDFKFFVTFTYDPEKKDRLNDEITRRTFTIWANNMRKLYPDMFYVAVPEYHFLGGLHYHLLVGGIKWEDMKPQFWKLDKNGTPIYTATAWRWGWSTVSVIKNIEASKHYICKYITKQHFDERFFGKRRFHTSHNIIRPHVYSCESENGDIWTTLNLDMWQVLYLHKEKRFGVFYTDGNGILDTTYNDAGTRSAMKIIADASKQSRTRDAFASAGRPHSTIRTLNSNLDFVNTRIKETSDYYLDY